MPIFGILPVIANVNEFLERLTAMSCRRAIAGLISFLLPMLAAAPGQAGDQIFCQCKFDPSSGYSAVGIRSACSSFTKEKSCKIAFGGLGSQGAIAAQIGVDPSKLRDEAFRLTFQTLEADLRNQPEQISTPAFLQEAIVVYMRAAYLREGVDVDPSTLRDLDEQVQSFAKEYSSEIADVFQSKREPFDRPWKERHRVEVQKGAVRFTYDQRMVVVAVFFRDGPP
jgi:hypothetical protein